MTATIDHAQTKARLQELRQQMLSSAKSGPGPPPRGGDEPGPELATKKQITALLGLLRAKGKKRYLETKAALNIEAKIPDLSKAEAWRLINKLLD